MGGGIGGDYGVPHAGVGGRGGGAHGGWAGDRRAVGELRDRL